MTSPQKSPFIISTLQAFLPSLLLFSYYNYNVVFPTSASRINGNALDLGPKRQNPQPQNQATREKAQTCPLYTSPPAPALTIILPQVTPPKKIGCVPPFTRLFVTIVRICH